MSGSVDGRRPGAVRQLFAIVLTTALSTVAGSAFGRVIDFRSLVAPLLIAAVVPALICVFSAVLARLPLLFTLSVQLGLFIPIGWVVAVYSAAPGYPAGFSDVVVDGITDAWRSLLISTLPATATPPVVFLLMVLVGWAAAVSSVVVLSRVPLAALFPPLIVLTVALAYGASNAGSTMPVVAAVVALAVVLAGTVRTQRAPHVVETSVDVRDRRLGEVSRAAGVATVAAFVTVVALLITPHWPGLAQRPRYDLRSVVQAAHVERTQINPLVQASAWAAETDPAELFRIRGTTSGNLRLVVLDAYDGEQWLSNASYVPAGVRIPSSAPTQGATTRLDVAIGTLPGPWVPAPDRPVRVEGAAVRVDPNSATLLAVAGVASGLNYTVESTAPVYDGALLSASSPASGVDTEAARTLPVGAPASLARAASEAVAGATFPYQQMVRLQDWMSNNLTHDPQAPSGHSYGRIEEFLATSHRGTAEQFATAFALMARTLGFPTRVAVGFVPGSADAAGVTAVHTTDVLVWPEVDFAQLGWIPFYPTPLAEQPSNSVRELTPSLGEPEQRTELDDQILQQGAGTPEALTPPASDVGVSKATIAAAVVIALILITVLLPLVRTATDHLRRRRRRLDGSPRMRVASAWEDALRSVAAAGVAHPTNLSGAEVVIHGAEAVGPGVAAPLASLAVQAQRALFAPDADADADPRAAWEEADRVRRLARTAMSWQSRLRLAYGLASMAPRMTRSSEGQPGVAHTGVVSAAALDG